MASQRRVQSGRIWLVLLVILALGMGTTVFIKEKHRRAEQAEAQRVETERRQAEQRQAEAEKRRADEERAELAERAKKSQQVDLLAQSLKAIDDVVAKWGDAQRVAGATSRIALSGPMSSLQAIRREADAVVVPSCLSSAKGDLLQGMSTIIDAFIAFSVNSAKMGELDAAIKFEAAKPMFERFTTARAACPKA
ncbi:MAG: hypothetical protein V4505_18940 [Pseudomonadota bacterium]